MSTIEQPEPRERIADDLIVGAAQIADELGLTRKQVYDLAARGKLPVGKLGKSLIASRRQLARHTDKITRGKTAA